MTKIHIQRELVASKFCQTLEDIEKVISSFELTFHELKIELFSLPSAEISQKNINFSDFEIFCFLNESYLSMYKVLYELKLHVCDNNYEKVPLSLEIDPFIALIHEK